jgi:hypothetical protein
VPYLTGFCVAQRYGEFPQSPLYRFANVYYLNQLSDGSTHRPDWLVYTRPFTGFSNGLDDQLVGGDTGHCLERLREDFGAPDYQDDALLAWRLRND